MKFRLRPGTPEDVEACWQLDQVCFPPGIAFSREIMAELFVTAAVKLIAAGPDGMAGFVVADHQAGDSEGLIVTLDIEPQWRRQGIGTALLEAAQDKLLAHGAELVFLHVAVNNREAGALYKKLGYIMIQRLRGYYGPRNDALLLARFLGDNGAATE